MGSFLSKNLVDNKGVPVCPKGCKKNHSCILWDDINKSGEYNTSLLIIKRDDCYECKIRFVSHKDDKIFVTLDFTGEDDKENCLRIAKKINGTGSKYPEGWKYVEETLDKLGL